MRAAVQPPSKRVMRVGGSRPAAVRSHASAPPAKVQDERLDAAVQAMLDEPVQLKSYKMSYVPNPNDAVPDAIASLASASDIANGGDFAEVAWATLRLGVGALDPAHSMLTPLSWPSPCPFNYSEPKKGGPAEKPAAVLHSLIHRFEGNNVGEFGTGWQNSGFWSSAGSVDEVHVPLLQYAQSLAEKIGDEQLQKHVSSHGNMWRPSNFTKLWRSAMDTSEGSNEREFAHKVQMEELRLFFWYAVRKSYEMD